MGSLMARLASAGVLAMVGGAWLWHLAHAARPQDYRAGPWPGLSPRGGGVLLATALLLAAGATALGSPQRALPDLPLLAVVCVLPLALATAIVQTPGVATAVCGAYLLPRSLLSLVDPSLALPPLLLLPAFAFDLGAWSHPSHLRLLGSLWPRRRVRWRRPRLAMVRLRPWRTALAGALFGALLVLVEPGFRLLLGGPASAWSGPAVPLAGISATLGCGVVACLSQWCVLRAQAAASRPR